MDNTQPNRVVFVREFTQAAQEYLANNSSATIKGFAETLGVDEQTIWGWATKHTKDENGKVTEQLARPHFFEAIQAIKKVEDAKSREEDTDLNPKQELFCQLYATEKEFFGNGVQSYIEAYEPDTSKPNWYKSACVCASQLLSNIKVCQRITELLEDGMLNDLNVDKQLSLVIMQNSDLSSKVAAIREYNKLKTRILTKIDHTTNGKDLPTPIYAGKSE